jgi:hypothetical protein
LIAPFVAAAVFGSAAYCAEDGGLVRVAIVSSESTSWNESAPFSPKLEFDLALGENIDDQVVELTPRNGSSETFRVQVQFETALAVGDEGPHLDLVGWNGCKSSWRDAEQLSPLRFRLPKPTTAEETCFAKVSGKDIRAEVARRGGKRWARLVRNVQGPATEPLYVAIAYVRIAVQRMVSDAWRTGLTIEARVPMGC